QALGRADLGAGDEGGGGDAIDDVDEFDVTVGDGFVDRRAARGGGGHRVFHRDFGDLQRPGGDARPFAQIVDRLDAEQVAHLRFGEVAVGDFDRGNDEVVER